MARNPIILITGANTGLGFETVRSLYQSANAYTILLGGRSLEKANAAVQQVQTEFPHSASVAAALQVDIEDDDSISQAFQNVAKQYDHIDVLINNAGKEHGLIFKLKWLICISGGQFDQQVNLGNMSMREMWNKSWNVNTAGTHILTHTFVPLLLKSSDPRLIFITSGTSTLAESETSTIPVNQSPAKGWPKQSYGVIAYRSSKTGMNMMMREWARILKEDGVKIWCVSPGYLATGLGTSQETNKKMGAIDPTIGANFIRDVVQGARDEDVGKAIRRDDVQPW